MYTMLFYDMIKIMYNMCAIGFGITSDDKVIHMHIPIYKKKGSNMDAQYSWEIILFLQK